MRRLLLTTILLAGLAEFGYGAWIPAKAWLSQVLLQRAWEKSLLTQESQKPWPWFDTDPVFKLVHTVSGEQHIVLRGDNGQALAFGPGHLPGSARPGETGNIIISAHRDTHFSFLENIRENDSLELQTLTGKSYRYRVSAIQIANARHERIQVNTPDERMTLVTCYPFDAIDTGSPLRFVVTAIRELGTPQGEHIRPVVI